MRELQKLLRNLRPTNPKWFLPTAKDIKYKYFVSALKLNEINKINFMYYNLKSISIYIEPQLIN